MHIEKLIIKNYRNFKNLEVELKPFTLIIGENNIGKTNFLNALGLIFSQDITFFKKRNLEIDDINYQAIENFKKELINDKIPISDIEIPSVEVIAELVGFNEDQESVVADWAINKKLDRVKITYLFHPKVELKDWIQKERDRLNTLNNERQLSKEDLIKNINFPISKYNYTIYGGLNQTKQIDFYFLKMLKYEFLDAIRDVKKELTANGNYRMLYKVLTNREDGKYQDILDAIGELDTTVKANSELKNIENQISKYLAKTSLVEKENQNKIEFQFSNLEEYDILKKLSLLYGDSPLTIERNGTGRNNLLFISLILSHLINAKKDGVYYRLIGIEEPEAHLHPHLQEHLAKNIEEEVSQKLQLIITSHSTHIINKLSLNNTVIFFNEENNVKCHYILDGFERFKNGNLKSKSKKHVRYLERYLDSTKSTMFFARNIILVEGISEQILVPQLFEQYSNGISLEKIGCSVVNVNGVAFSHFLEIIKNGYFKKCLVLTDSDSEKQTQMRAPDLKDKYNDNNILISITHETDTFEKELINSNLNDKGKNFLLLTLFSTRRNKAKEFHRKYKNIEIEVEEYFELIESYKADFATDLKYTLQRKAKSKKADFTIPKYILDGFKHIFPLEKSDDKK
ncbi:AAA family ATPase [Desulfobacula sp.]|uniref:ATP-dependent nuclease n=1 Tax=Desulfobacula sp. TaxID=2593537 RepID=UPI0025BC135D|nr:AAA family ATPase [Desulfobacula sp.]MBC2703730.1 AAA family ATPase [Desulfobacula sp.]